MIKFYKSLEKKVKQQLEVKKWIKAGKPSPPPHIIKQKSIRKFANQFNLNILVETGTFYGDMVEAMKTSFSTVYSIELSPELHAKAQKRFSNDQNVKIICGDSGVELKKIVNEIKEPALFWLDGHYSAGETARGEKDTPIFEELAHIFSRTDLNHVIIIDDARCFGTTPGYPTVDELKSYIHSQNPQLKIEIDDDNIRIYP